MLGSETVQMKIYENFKLFNPLSNGGMEGLLRGDFAPSKLGRHHVNPIDRFCSHTCQLLG